MDEFIDPGLQQFTRQHIRMGGELYKTQSESFPWVSLDFFKKTDMSQKKIAQDFNIDCFSSRYKYNCTVHI